MLHTKEIQPIKDVHKMNNKTSFKQLKPEFTDDSLGVNPFRTGFKIVVRPVKTTFKSTDLENVKIDSDVVNIGTTSTNEKIDLLESEHKTQVYTSSDTRKYISKLSLKAKSLYLWLIYDIDYSKEYVWINVPRYMKENDVSANTYRDSVKELARKGVLCPIYDLQNMFWINPRLFFKGSRVKAFNKHLKMR